METGSNKLGKLLALQIALALDDLDRRINKDAFGDYGIDAAVDAAPDLPLGEKREEAFDLIEGNVRESGTTGMLGYLSAAETKHSMDRTLLRPP